MLLLEPSCGTCQAGLYVSVHGARAWRWALHRPTIRQLEGRQCRGWLTNSNVCQPRPLLQSGQHLDSARWSSGLPRLLLGAKGSRLGAGAQLRLLRADVAPLKALLGGLEEADWGGACWHGCLARACLWKAAQPTSLACMRLQPWRLSAQQAMSAVCDRYFNFAAHCLSLQRSGSAPPTPG